MTDVSDLIEAYACGPRLLREAVREVPESSWDATPIEGKWSLRQVVCHLADSEVVYSDRMKRVIVEENPTLFEADPDLMVPALFCSERPWKTELDVIEIIRVQMLPILRSCGDADFERTGEHSLEGRMTLKTLLERIAGHIPHHLSFIQDKLHTLGHQT